MPKHKMSNLGMKPETMGMPESHHTYYPQVHLNENQMPDLANYDVQDPISITFEGFITGKNVVKSNGETDTSFSIELRRGGIYRREDAEK